jgi:hypothetical protein
MPKIIFPGGGSGGGGSFNLTIQEEGSDVQTNVNTINFVGADVEAQAGSSGVVLVYIPPPTFASHYNTQDGTTDGRVRQSGATIETRYISNPTSEGNPFNTGGDAESNALASNTSAITLAPNADITAMDGCTFKVDVTEPDGTVMETYTTPAISGNGANTSPSGDIVVTISSYSSDTTKFKGRVSILVTYADILSTAGFDGGKFNIVITQTVTDGTGPHVFNLSTSSNPTIQGDFFYDTNTLPSFPQNVAITETSGSVTTKHLSGLEYYTTGSQFTASCDGLDNLNRNTALTSSNITVLDNSTYGFSNIDQSPLPGGTGNANFTGWTSAYDNTGTSYSNNAVSINRSSFRFTGTNGRINIRTNLVWGGSNRTTASSNDEILIDTYSTSSSNLSEIFDSENRRLESDYTTSWTSTNALAADKGATCKIEVVDNSLIQSGDTITLVDTTGTNRVLTAGTTFTIGASASDTATNIFNAINSTYGTQFTAVVDTYTSTIVNVTQDVTGPSGNQTNASSRATAITVANFEEGANDGMVYYGQLQQATQAQLGGTGTINTDWSSYKPDAGGANPDYTSLSGPATFYREFTDTSGLSRSSFQMVFTGTFVSNATTDLANEDLRIFVRKVASPTGGALVGTSVVPMRLHGGTFGSSGPFDQGQTVGGSYIREGSSSGNTVNASFGTFACEDGIYVEIMIYNSTIKIDRIDVTFF